MCPNAAKVSREYQVYNRIVTTSGQNNNVDISASSRRMWVRFFCPLESDPATTPLLLRVLLILNSTAVAIGGLSQFQNTLELSFEKHGQAVFGPFGFYDGIGNAYNVHFTEAIVTMDVTQL